MEEKNQNNYLVKWTLKEVSDRTDIGKVIKYTFIVYNICMFVWFISALYNVYYEIIGSSLKHQTDFSSAYALGTYLGIGMMTFFWSSGSVILGSLTFLTKRKKIIVIEKI